jgi:plasmid maintenance system antidote protein VapI
MSTERIQTRGGRALQAWLRSQGKSIQSWCTELGLDRVRIQRLINGERSKRVTVDLAFQVQLATNGAVPASLFCSYEVPASERRKSA